jgi:hypothetical protein
LPSGDTAIAVILICVHVPSPKPKVLPIQEVFAFSAVSAEATQAAKESQTTSSFAKLRRAKVFLQSRVTGPHYLLTAPRRNSKIIQKYSPECGK